MDLASILPFLRNRNSGINPALMNMPSSYGEDGSNVSNVDTMGNPDVSSTEQQPIQQQQPRPELAPVDVAARMHELYQPTTTSSDAYSAALATAPNREDYHVSKMRRLGAMIAGMGAGGPAAESHGAMIGFKGNPSGAFNTASGIVNAPFDQAQEDYTGKIGTLSKAATIEEKGNNDKRILAEQTIGREVQARNSQINSTKAAEVERENKEKDKIRVKDEERKQKATDALDFARRNPNWILAKTKGGTLVYVNPKNPDEVKDTGLESGTLSEEDSINLRAKNAKSLEEVKQRNRTALENTKESNREKLAGQNIQGRKDVKATPSGGSNPGAAKSLSPTQDKVAVYNRAQKALADNPELKGYINLGAGNTVVISKPMFGDKDKMDKAHDLVYPPATKDNKDEMVHVLGPNGEKGMMKKSEIAQHKGWKVG